MSKLLSARFLSALLATSSLVGPALAAAPGAEQAAAMESRARAQIAAFPGYTLHGADHAYARRDAIVDNDGAQHVRFERSYRGMAVIGGDLVVHADRNGNFREASHSLRRGINVARGAALSQGRAIQAALGAHAGSTNGIAPTLVVYARGDTPVP